MIVDDGTQDDDADEFLVEEKPKDNLDLDTENTSVDVNVSFSWCYFVTFRIWNLEAGRMDCLPFYSVPRCFFWKQMKILRNFKNSKKLSLILTLTCSWSRKNLDIDTENTSEDVNLSFSWC